MHKKLVTLLSILFVALTTFAYSALSTSLAITSEVTFRAIADIRVNGIAINSASGGAVIQYESKYSRDSISSGFTLPNANSSISYTVHIDNTGDVDYTIYDVLMTSSSDPGLQIDLGSYNLKDIIPAKSSLDLIVTYTTTNPSDNVINVTNDFDFRRVFRISYNTGTSQTIPTQIKYERENLTLTSTVPTRNGYTFYRWNTKQDGTGVNYNSGATYTVDEDKILYATWNITNYNITYVLNGGTNGNNPSTYTVETNNITLADATKDGYTFKGWTGNGTTTPTKNLVLPKGSYGDKEFTANFEDETDPVITVKNQDGSVDYLQTAHTVNAAFGSNQSNVRVWINATDVGSGIASIEYAYTNSSTAPSSGWTTTTNGELSVNKTPGNYYLHVKATDSEGNETVVTTKLITARLRVAYYDDYSKSTTISANQYYVDSALTSRTPAAVTGYTFDGWYSDQALTTKVVNANTSYTPTNSIQLYGKWTINNYSITYTLNGGSVSGTNPTTYNVNTNTFTLINPTKNGYTFKGWSGTGLTGDENTTVTIAKGSTGNRSYTANWTLNSYVITYNLNGGQIGTECATERGTCSFSGTKEVCYGSAGTYTCKQLTGPITCNPTTFDGKNPTPGKKKHCYISATNPVAYSIESPTFTLNNPVKQGYTFKGWSGTGLTGDENTTVTVPTGSTGNRTYTANYTAKTYTMTINPNGGTYNGSTGNTTKTMTYGTTNNNDIGIPTKEGYTFNGWTSNYGTVYSATGKNVYTPAYWDAAYPNGTWRFDENLTITASWTANQYTVTANAEGGSIPSTTGWTGTGNTSTKPVTYGSAYGTLPTPTRTGYTFKGWNGKNLFDLSNTYRTYASISGDTITFDGSVISGNTGSSIRVQAFTGNQYVRDVCGYKTTPGEQVCNFVSDNYDRIVVKLNTNKGDPYIRFNNVSLVNGNSYTVSYNLTAYNSSTATATIENLQIEEGTTATTYEPYYIDETTIVTTAGDHDIYAKWADESAPTNANITSTNSVASSQTATLTCSDTVGVTSYYWGTTAPTDSSTYTDITSTTSMSVNKTVSDGGTYYLACKDAAGNKSTTVSKVFYKTTFNMTDGTVSPASVVTMAGNSFNLPTPTPTSGYTAKGLWYTNSQMTIDGRAYGASYTPASSIEMYSSATLDTFTVEVVVNNGTVSPVSKVVTRNDTTTFTVGANTGYNNPTVSCTNSQTATISGTTLTTGAITSNTVCTVTYVAKTYTLTIDPNGGTYNSTTSTSSKTMTYDASTNNDIGVPTRSGYTFAGWYTQANGGVQIYDENGRNTNASGYWSAAYSTGVWKHDGTVTVYAKWTKPVSELTKSLSPTTYVYDGSSKSPTPTVKDGTTTLTRGTEYTITYGDANVGEKTATITGAGVYNATTKAYYTGTTTLTYYINNAGLTFDKGTCTATTGTTTLYTKTGVNVVYTTIRGTTTGTIPTASKTGYTFDGWYTTASGTGSKVLNANGTFTGTAVSGYTSTNAWATVEDKTLYARCTPATYTVTANANGGSIPSTTGWTGTGATSTKQVTYNSAYGTLPTPTKTGYTFQGWSKNLFDIQNMVETYRPYQNIAPEYTTFDGQNVWKMNGTINATGRNIKYMEGVFKSNTQYTIYTNVYHQNETNSYAGVIAYACYNSDCTDRNTIISGQVNQWADGTTVVPANKSLLYISFSYGTGAANTYFKDFIIEEGTQITDASTSYMNTSTLVKTPLDHNIYAKWSINDPATPTITGGTTKIYGSSATTLTCSSSTSYASGATKYYSFGYATSDGGTPGNWSTPTTANTLSVASDYVGQRWYSCRVYATDGTQTSGTVTSATSADTEMTVNNATLTFNKGTCDSTSGTTTLYTKNGANVVYTTIRGTTTGTIPTASKTGYSFDGWYTSASGTGSKVLNSDNSFTGTAVSGYTTTNAWATVANQTLYARCSANSYTVTADANGGSIASTTGWTGTGASATKSVTYDAAYGTLPTPTKAGFTFAGWTNQTDVKGEMVGYGKVLRLSNTVSGYTNPDYVFNENEKIVFDVTIPNNTINSVDVNDINADSSTYTISGNRVYGTIPVTQDMRNHFYPTANYKFVDINAQQGISNYTISKFKVVTETDTKMQIASAHNLYALWSINDPSTPTISGGATKVYGASATQLTCSENTTYASGATKYYSFGYATTDGGTPSNWTNYSNANTLSVSSDYVGQRWYSCKVKASDGSQTSSEVASATTADQEVTVNNATLTFDKGTCASTSGTTTLYTKQGANVVYTTIRGTTTGTIPTASKTGYNFLGWYTTSSGTGSKVLNANGTFTGTAVSGYTTASAWDTIANQTLYARCSEKTYTLTINPNGGTYNSTTSNSSKTMTYNATTNNDIGIPTRDGYTFDGWYLAANNKTSKMYDNTGKNVLLSGYWDAAYSTGKWVHDGDATIYAHWSKPVSSLTKSISPTNYIYDGNAKSPTPTVKDGSTSLTNGTEYTIAYGDASVGDKTATITGANVYNSTTKAYYTGTTTVTYYINNATLTFDATTNGGTLNGTSPMYARKGTTGVYTGVRNSTAGTIPTASKTGWTFTGWYDGNTKVINADGTIVASVSNWTDSSKNWLITTVKTLTAKYEPVAPSSVTISGGATKVYNSTATTLTCTAAGNYASGTTKYYSFGYATSDGGTPSNWTTYSSTNTLTVANNAYVGQRWYSCKAYASDGSQSTAEVVSPTTGDQEVTINNAKLVFDATTNGGTISGTTPLYARYGASGVYTGIRNETAGTIPTATKTGWSFSGWYSGNTKVINNDGSVVASVSNWTDSSSKWLITADQTLTAKYTINNPATPTITGGATRIYGASATTLTCSTTSTYATGTKKYYSFGYATSDGGTPSNWTTYSETNTLSVATDYVGQRWYSCKVKASDGTSTSSEVASATSADQEVTTNNAKITYNANNCGTISGTSPAYVKKGTTGVLTTIRGTTAGTVATVSKAGYTFNGWYDGNTKVINADGTIVASVSNWTDSSKNWLITEDKTLTASCTPNTYSITLNNQDATTAGTTKVYYQYKTTKVIDNVTCYYYTDSALTTCLSGGYYITNPARTGYTFHGYYLAADSGTQYVNSSGAFVNNIYQRLPSEIDSSYTTDIPLYAKWSKPVSSLTNSVSPTTYIYDGSAKSPTPTVKDGNTTLTNGTHYTISYGDATVGEKTATITGAEVYNSTTKAFYTGTTTVPYYINNAKLTFNATTDGVISYTVRVQDLYVRKGTSGAYTDIRSDTAATIPTATKVGYTFNGWYTAASGGTKVINANGTLVASVSGWTDSSGKWLITADSTLYAQYTKASYTLTFDANGGSVGTSTKSVQYGTTYNDLPTPTRTGYTFKGWYADLTGTSDYINYGREYMYTDKISIHVSAYKDDWSTFVNQRIYSSTEGGGLNIEPSGEYFNFAAYNAGAGYKSILTTVKYTELSTGWHDFDFVFDGSYAYAYVDGVNVGTSAQFNANGIGYHTYNSMFIGAEAYSSHIYPSGGNFTGNIGNIIIKNDDTLIPGTTYNTITAPAQDLTLYARWEINDPATPTITGGATKVYGAAATTLTCSTSTTYPSGTNKYYSFGYATSDGGTPANWTTATTTNTLSVATDYVGQRWYSCRVYASDGTATSGTVTSAASADQEVTVNNATISFVTNGTSADSALYVRKGTTGVYTGIRNSTAGTIPIPTRNGYTFNGWYTAASAGTKVINADGTIVASVSNWTDSSKKWLITAPNTLYAQWTEKTYTLTINPNGGSLDGSTSTVVRNLKYSDVSDITTPTRTGYTFAGWAELEAARKQTNDFTSVTKYANAGANAMSTTSQAKSSDNPLSGMSNEIKIINDGSAAISPGLGGYHRQLQPTVSTSYVNVIVAKVPTGHYLHPAYNNIGTGSTVQWLTSNEGTGEWQTYAYQINTGTGTLGTIGFVYVSKDKTNTWSMRRSETGAYTAYLGFTNIYDVTANSAGIGQYDGTGVLTAQWTANQYSVAFNANGGSGGQSSSVTATYGSAMPAISTTAPTKAGHTFLGWYDSASGGTQYYTAAGASAKNYDKTSGTTLYAHWSANPYTVSFNANGGTGGQSADVTATYGSAMPTISTTAPTRTNYTFMGWYDNQNYAASGAKQYYTAAGASARSYDKASATTLYAGWKINNPATPTITGGATKVYGSSAAILTCSTTSTYPTGTSLYYSFGYATSDGGTPSNWTTASTTNTLSVATNYVGQRWYSCKVYASDGTATSDTIASLTTADQEVTVNNAKITYNANSCGTITGTSPAYVKSGMTGVYTTIRGTTAGTVAKVTANTGYTFNGWYSGSTKVINADGTIVASVANWTDSSKNWLITEDKTLTASCTAKTYTLTIDPNGGTYNSTTSTSSKTMTYNATTNNDIGTPTRDGYTFAGWYTAANGGTQIYGSNGRNVAANGYWDAAYNTGKWKYDGAVTVYAKWTKAVTATTNSISPTSYIYNGSAKTPTPTVKDGNTTLTSGTDYTISYANNTNVGTATATITGAEVYNATTKAYYTGSTTINYYINNATLTFNAGSCTSVSGTSTLYTKTGATAVYTTIRGTTAGTIPTATKTGYTFQGWYTATNGTKVLNANGTFTSSAVSGYTTASAWATVEDKTLYAVCTPTSYTVTANASGGSIASTSGWTGTGATSTKSVTYDSAYGTLPTISKTGYTFAGWSLLPEGYKPVEYIESTGTQYIDTGVLGSKDIGYDLEFKVNEYGSEKGIFSTSTANSGPHYVLQAHSGYVRLYLSNASNSVVNVGIFQNDTNFHNLKYNTNNDFKMIYDDSTITTSTVNNTPDIPYSYVLFARKYGNIGVINNSKIALKSAKIYNNGELVRDFVPCVQISTGKAGLYDRVNGVFYGNDATTGDDFTVPETAYYITSETIVKTASNHNIYAYWSINNPATPTITGGATKVYGSSATQLTCSTTSTYATGTNKYYSFGYATSDGGTPSNWTTPTTTNTLNVATDYVGQRWYSCRVYASDGTITSATATSATSADQEVTVNNAKITYSANNCGTISGTSPAYVKKGTTGVYTTIRGTTAGTVATVSKTGSTFNGWYSGSTKVINADGTIVASVSNWTDASKNWLITEDKTLTASCTAKTYTLTIDPNGGSYNSSTSTSSKTMTYGSTNNNDIGTPTRDGYTFAGWYTAANGGTQIYDASGQNTNASSYWTAAYNTGTWKYDGAVTVYAKWTKAVSSLNTTLNKDAFVYTGSAQGPTVTVKDGNTTLTSGTHYTVSGNSNTNVGEYTVTITGSGTYNTTTKAYYTGTTTKTYYINNAKLTFNVGTCTTGSGTLYTKTGATGVYTTIRGTTAGTIPTGSKTGYQFDGWYTASSGGSQVLTSANAFTGTAVSGYTTASAWATVEDKTLYARCNTAKTYTLTIDPNGGSYNSSTSTSTKTMTYASTNNNDIGTPTRDGYTFAGWYTAANGGTQIYDTSGHNTNASSYWTAAYNTGTWKYDGAVTVYAKWTKAVSALTNSVSPTSYVYNGSAKTPAATVKDGNTTLTSGTHYTVSYASNTNVGTATATITGSGTYNTTTKAYYTGTATVNYYINNATLTFNAGTCTSVSGTTPLYTRTGATAVYTGIRETTTTGTIPTASKTGYTFAGWYTASSGGTKVLNANGTFTSSAVSGYTTASAWATVEDKILYARCDTAKTYTLTIDPNGGTYSSSTSTSTKTMTYGSTNNNDIGTPTRDGYTFAGWYTAQNGGTQVYDASGHNTNASSYWTAAYSTGTWKYDGALTVYAKWTKAVSSLTITANQTDFVYNGSAQGPTITVKDGNTTLTSGTDYSIIGASSTNVGSYNATITGSSVYNTTTKAYYTGSTTKAYNINNATLTFDATTNGGSISGTTPLYARKGQTGVFTQIRNSTAGTMPTATKTGWTFNGWYTASSNGTKIVNSDGTIVASVSNWTDSSRNWLITANQTLYAQYTIQSHAVHYDCTTNGGTGSIADKTVNYGTAVDLTPTCTKSGWTFVGWNTSSSATSQVSPAPTMGTTDITLYAIYRKEAITLNATLNANGATLNPASPLTRSCTLAAVYNNATQDTSCTVDMPTVSRTSYTLVGWNTTSGATTNNSSYNTSTKKLTLTASNTGNTWYAITRANNQLTATFADNNGATVASTSATCYLYNQATSCTVDAPTVTPQSGFSKIGFNTTTSATTNNSNYNTSTNKLTISANGTWYPITKSNSTFSATFRIQDSNAVNESETTVTCYRYNGATKCSVIAPSLTAKSGYTALGWGSQSGTTATYAPGDSVEIPSYLANITLFSKTYYNTPITATFSRNTSHVASQTPYGGSASTAATVSSSCYKYNGATSCDITSPTINPSTGYKVVGYNTTASATTSTWNHNTSKTLSANATYYAITTPNTYYVKYNANCPTSSSGTMADSTFLYGGSYNLRANAYSCTGYIFDKWTINQGGTGISYTDQQAVSNLTLTDGATVNLYAQWKEVWAENLSFDNTTARTKDSTITCIESQCMIDTLWERFNQIYHR